MNDERPTHVRVLAAPMAENNAGAQTVGEYLVKLVDRVWRRGDEFSGKRPFGYSSWCFEVYSALISAGLIEGTFDEDGYVDKLSHDERLRADELVADAIKHIRKLIEKETASE